MVVEKKEQKEKKVDPAKVALIKVEDYYKEAREVYPKLNAWEGATILIESKFTGKIVRIVTRVKSGITYYIVEK